MKTLRFRTNINCSGCVAKVTPFLSKDKSIESWEVDTVNPEKILSVTGESITEEQIKELVEEAGFKVKENLE